MNISLLRIFVSVAENSSFSRAAGEMYRSQSAVSMQIKKLEETLGVQVFQRGGKNIQLSAEGEIFLDYARQIIRLVDESMSAVHRKNRGGAIRIGCVEDYAARVLPPVLATFWERHPDSQIEVRTGEMAEMLDRLGHDYDVIIAAHPAGSGEGERIFADRLVWVVAPDAVFPAEEPLTIALRSEATLDRQWATAALDAQGRTWHCPYLSSGIGTLQVAVEDGLAVGIFKEATTPHHLRILGVEDGFPALPSIEICLHFAPDAEAKPGVHEVAELLRNMPLSHRLAA